MKIAFLLYGLTQNGGMKVLFRVGDLLEEQGNEVTYYVPHLPRELPFPSHCKLVFASKDYRSALSRISWLAQVPMCADVAIATSHPTAYSLVWNQSSVARRMYYVQAYEPEFYSDSSWHLFRRWPMMLMAAGSYLLPLEKVVNCDGSRRGLTWKDRLCAPELPPGIDLAIYRPRPKPSGDPVIGHISRREHWKGSDHFFRAMVRLRDRGNRFRVRVAYDLWPDTHGLDYEAVHPKSEHELAEYYAGLDVLVSTVKQKGFGYPPLEAMSCGAVCVSTPIDFGTPGVDHVPISAYSTESIVLAVERVISSKGYSSFLAAGLRTAARYDWDNLAQQWSHLISRHQVQ